MNSGNCPYARSYGRGASDCNCVDCTAFLEGDNFQGSIYQSEVLQEPPGNVQLQTTGVPLRFGDSSAKATRTYASDPTFNSFSTSNFADNSGAFDDHPIYGSEFGSWNPLDDLDQYPAPDGCDTALAILTKDRPIDPMAQRTPPPEPTQNAFASSNHGTGTARNDSATHSAPGQGPIDTYSDMHQSSLRPNMTVQKVLLNWIRHSIAKNVNPVADKDGMNTLAAAHNVHPMDVAAFVGAHARGFPSVSMDRPLLEQPTSTSAPSTPMPSSEETYQLRKALADQYVAEKAHGSCNMSPAMQSPGGMYRCPYERCQFGHPRHDEWKRHLESRQPQQVYVCYLCFCSQSAIKGKISVEHRRDKHMKHLRDAHKVVDIERHISKSQFSYPENYSKQCVYQAQGESQVCGAPIKSWKEQLEHLAAHYKSEPKPDFQESDGDSVRSRSTGKRASATPQPSSRKRRNAANDLVQMMR